MIDHLQPLRCLLHRRAQLFERALSGTAVEQRQHPHDGVLRGKALCDRLAVKFRKCAVKRLLIEAAVFKLPGYFELDGDMIAAEAAAEGIPPEEQREITVKI